MLVNCMSSFKPRARMKLNFKLEGNSDAMSALEPSALDHLASVSQTIRLRTVVNVGASQANAL